MRLMAYRKKGEDKTKKKKKGLNYRDRLMMVSLVVNKHFWTTVRVCGTVQVEPSTATSDPG
jgi:hypothetical protein